MGSKATKVHGNKYILVKLHCETKNQVKISHRYFITNKHSLNVKRWVNNLQFDAQQPAELEESGS